MNFKEVMIQELKHHLDSVMDNPNDYEDQYELEISDTESLIDNNLKVDNENKKTILREIFDNYLDRIEWKLTKQIKQFMIEFGYVEYTDHPHQIWSSNRGLLKGYMFKLDGKMYI